ncbi:centrosomal protein of 104 kDa-like [Mucor ambiguus]|uniref:Centrosomal protein of 104 kDa-like n=1 Tax=Mucor ambiguus TaxID=91626 RepID=A0A0C9MFB0_9FUNG|nr:centrosomal protein of 104 kDa-like [Mucor ambiguus]
MGNNSLPYEVVHCSSWDDDYNPEQLVKSSPGNHQQVEPQQIKCKGWQTPKCPEYPQDLIIHLLSGASRISKVQILSHHFKIATRIDVYIGTLKDPQDVLEDIAPDTPPSEDEDNMLIEFSRLGYVCFDNNARAQFRARELKSIKINADGEYVRLVIRNCHRNRLNTYNQVGILALNILGQPSHLVDKNDIMSACNSSSNNNSSMPQQSPFDDNSILSSSTRRTSVSSNQSQVSRLPTSSVAEMELQHWTVALLHAEEEAVRGESYQIAKTYKYLGDKLERFTKILADLEIGKRHAVETKDYDEAEKIKDDIKEIKQAADAMLKHAHICIEDGRVVPLDAMEDEDDEKVMHEPPSPLPQQQPFEFDQLSHPNATEDTVIAEEANSSSHYIPPTTHTTSTAMMDPESIPEPIMDEERIPYTLPIEIFGEDTVACVLSIKAVCRKRGLTQIEQYMIQQAASQDVVHATLLMMQEAVMDSREAIVCQAMDVWHQTHHMGELADISCMERAFGGLLKRTSDSNVNIRQTATELVLVLVQDYPSLLQMYVCKPERIIHNHKEAKARVQLVETTVSKLQVSLQDVMSFVVVYLKHVHEDVRQAAVKLLVAIADQFGFHRVSTYIDESLKVSLADSVKKLVDKEPSNFKKGSVTKDTLTELRALTVAPPQQPEKKTLARVKKSAISSTSSASKRSTPSNTNNSTKAVKKQQTATRSTAKSTTTTTTATTPRERQKEKSVSSPAVAQQKPKQQPQEELNENNVCIFCDEANPEFNEDTLIKHYYNTCPVLTNCPMCQIITEIPTLNEHMLEDCERRHLIKKCSRCSQAIPVEQWLQHTLKQTCSDQVQCPLCLIAIEPATDEGWKLHLMTGEGCPKLKQSRSPNKKKPIASAVATSATATAATKTTATKRRTIKK